MLRGILPVVLDSTKTWKSPRSLSISGSFNSTLMEVPACPFGKATVCLPPWTVWWCHLLPQFTPPEQRHFCGSPNTLKHTTAQGLCTSCSLPWERLLSRWKHHSPPHFLLLSAQVPPYPGSLQDHVPKVPPNHCISHLSALFVFIIFIILPLYIIIFYLSIVYLLTLRIIHLKTPWVQE